ncbi:prostaglandin E synthase 3-like [Rhopilema esculentum]|uniref:prostaglandin E synthase 3-like n=1 Tax=Rhopilema esculentum TaxID=499914 RepID=UPI0031DC024D
MALHPPVYWAQRNDRILVSVQLEDVNDEKITVNNTMLSFSGKGGSSQNQYHVDLEFLKDIIPEESKQRKGGREYFFDLKKKEEGFWPRLLKETKKPPYLKVDFNRWKDEDDSDYEGDFHEPNLEDMMKNMGTIDSKGFDPEDGNADADAEDSDDEELPDLE